MNRKKLGLQAWSFHKLDIYKKFNLDFSWNAINIYEVVQFSFVIHCQKKGQVSYNSEREN